METRLWYWLSSITYFISTLYFETGPPLAWLISKPPGSSYLCHPVLELQAHTTLPAFYVSDGIQMLVLLLVKEVLHLYWAMFSAPVVMISRTWVPEVRGHAVTTLYPSVLCPVRAPGPPWMFRNWVKLNWRRENRRPREKYDEKAAKQRDQGRKTSFSTALSSLPPSRIYCSSLAWLRLLAS